MSKRAEAPWGRNKRKQQFAISTEQGQTLPPLPPLLTAGKTYVTVEVARVEIDQPKENPLENLL